MKTMGIIFIIGLWEFSSILYYYCTVPLIHIYGVPTIYQAQIQYFWILYAVLCFVRLYCKCHYLMYIVKSCVMSSVEPYR